MYDQYGEDEDEEDEDEEDNNIGNGLYEMPVDGREPDNGNQMVKQWNRGAVELNNDYEGEDAMQRQFGQEGLLADS